MSTLGAVGGIILGKKFDESRILGKHFISENKTDSLHAITNKEIEFYIERENLKYMSIGNNWSKLPFIEKADDGKHWFNKSKFDKYQSSYKNQRYILFIVGIFLIVLGLAFVFL